MKGLKRIFGFIVLAVVVVLGFWLRIYKIDSPVADWHSHRQADTASVTREYVEKGINLLIPKYHDLSNVQSGMENPNGFRMVEMPLYNLLGVGVYKIVGKVDLSMRVVSIGLMAVSAILVYLLSLSLTKNKQASMLGAGIFWLMPYSVYYSRAILPEPLALVTMLAAIYYFRKVLILSAGLMAVSILVKPYTAIISAPLLFFWSFEDFWKNRKVGTVLKYFAYVLLALLPFGWWRWWILRFPEGIPVSAWLFNNSDKAVVPEWWRGVNMKWLNRMVAFRPSWFRWIFIERITKLIVGIFGIIPLYLGFAYRRGRNQTVAVMMILGILLYFVVVAGGNLRHDYYQILILPFLCILMGWGGYYLGNFVFKSRLIGWAGVVMVMSLAWYVSWDQVKDYYKINNYNMIEAGKKADELLEKEALVVAPYMGDTAFLYQTKRRGWPIEVYNVGNIKEQSKGKKIYLVSINYDDYTHMMMTKYKDIYRDNNFIILDLMDEK